MKQQIRTGVFETNSSTQHTLTIVNKRNNIKSDRIPENTTFEFSNVLIENLEGDGYSYKFKTEQDKLALCIAYCIIAYEHYWNVTTDNWGWWDYYEDAEENGCTINDIVKDKLYFADLYAAIKEVRNTELVIVDAIYRLDSLNDNLAFSSIFCEFDKIDAPNNDLKERFKEILFDKIAIEDTMYPM